MRESRKPYRLRRGTRGANFKFKFELKFNSIQYEKASTQAPPKQNFPPLTMHNAGADNIHQNIDHDHAQAPSATTTKQR
jgi:hypothetical protein